MVGRLHLAQEVLGSIPSGCLCICRPVVGHLRPLLQEVLGSIPSRCHSFFFFCAMPGRFRSCAPIRIFGPFVCSRAIMRQASFLHGEWICRCARCHAAVRHVSCFSRLWPSCAQCGQEDTRGLLFTDVHHNWLGFLSRCALRGIRTFTRVE